MLVQLTRVSAVDDIPTPFTVMTWNIENLFPPDCQINP